MYYDDDDIYLEDPIASNLYTESGDFILSISSSCLFYLP